jgi:ribonuclease M5
MKLKETVVVEGRDDMSAVLAAVEADVIITHGYGITEQTLENIEAAYSRNGIVIFTDPDHAGRRIRERLEALFPEAKHAFLTERQAQKDGDTGVENASPEDIRKAMISAGCTASDGPDSEFAVRGSGSGEYKEVTADDMAALGLAGQQGSSERRAASGEALGIGNANAGAFLKRLRRLGIGLAELEKACGYKQP